MSILKNKTNRENFLIVSKIFLQDKNLSIAERGLLATMHSLPNNWEFSVSGMTKILPDGKSKIGTALDGLIKKGYIIKKQSKTSSGCFGKNILEINERPIPEKPSTENPSSENPPTENQTQYNNNKYSNKEYNNYQSINLQSDEIDDLREDVKEQISYDYACTQFGEERVDSIVNLIMEVCLSAGSIFIGKHELPARQVKNVFKKINIEHLRYVFDSLEESSREKKIRNMKSYLLTALYNAPITIDTYYASEVNYDMCNGGEN